MIFSRIVFTWIAFIVLSSSFTAAFASNPGPGSGFKAFRWGDPPLFYMDRVDSRDGMDVYFLPGESERYAGIDTATIRYFFRDGGLCQVEVAWRKPLGAREFKTLVASLTREWGSPDQAAGPGELFWRSAPAGTQAKLLAVDTATTPWTDYDAAVVVQSERCQ